MQICICDDEKELRKSLSRLIETHLQLEGIPCTIREYASGTALLEGLKEKEGDILFLDIEMKGLNGMDTAKMLRRSFPDIVLIFVTAYPDFVFQGYDVHAFHYILKPYKPEKIREVLRLAVEETKKTEEQYFYFEQKSHSIRLPLKDILYFKSCRKKVAAVTVGGQEEFYASLSQIEAELPPNFLRIHNRYLVNLQHVGRIGSTFCMCGEEELPVSRACRQELAAAFARKLLNP